MGGGGSCIALVVVGFMSRTVPCPSPNKACHHVALTKVFHLRGYCGAAQLALLRSLIMSPGFPWGGLTSHMQICQYGLVCRHGLTTQVPALHFCSTPGLLPWAVLRKLSPSNSGAWISSSLYTHAAQTCGPPTRHAHPRRKAWPSPAETVHTQKGGGGNAYQKRSPSSSAEWQSPPVLPSSHMSLPSLEPQAAQNSLSTCSLSTKLSTLARNQPACRYPAQQCHGLAAQCHGLQQPVLSSSDPGVRHPGRASSQARFQNPLCHGHSKNTSQKAHMRGLPAARLRTQRVLTQANPTESRPSRLGPTKTED